MSSDKKPSAPTGEEVSILRLTSREHVRLRPGMYFGGTDVRALHQLLFTVIDDMLYAAFKRDCTQVNIVLAPDNCVKISDNSSGIPMDLAERNNRSRLEYVMTVLNQGRWRGDRYADNDSMFGVGLANVNAVCASMIVHNRRDGFLWKQSYSQGIPQSEVEQLRPLGESETSGKSFEFTPDFTIFEQAPFDFERIAIFCRNAAYALQGLTIGLRDERISPAREEVFIFPDGIRALLAELAVGSNAISPVFHSRVDYVDRTNPTTHSLYSVEIAFQYTDETTPQIESFVDAERSDGGTQVDGLKKGLSRYFKKQGLENRKTVFNGLNVVISIFHPHQAFNTISDRLLLSTDVIAPCAEIAFNLLDGSPDGKQFIAYLKSRQS